ncbi:hypothetical protein MN04_00097 [Escherichia phage MN04]|uniref:Uncharacterized protein n=1 Tax=Escherichia phage MN04 TaxID=2711184 RepID=A0A858I6H5_9CAUD|nr:hypothetical protein MN04_00097 [Escherichia phage MN04]
MEILGFILLYFVLGFMTTFIIHKSGDWNPIEIESSYDAVFITLVWPMFWIVGIIMCIAWPFAKFYEKLFGL